MKVMKLLITVVLIAGFAFSSASAGVTPENGAMGVPSDTDLSIKFSEPVRPGEGVVSVVNASTNEVFFKTGINSVQVTFNKDRMFVQIPGELEKADYYVLISPTAVRDIAGNYYKGIETPERWTFSTLSGKPELERFNARSDRGIVELGWKTRNEKDIAGYKVYRSEHNAAGSGVFEEIDTYEMNEDLKASGDDILENYTKQDNDPELKPGQTYSYRLSAFDGNGKEVFSKMTDVEIAVDGLAKISNVQPNPAVDHVSFDLTLNSNRKVDVEVIDRIGRSVMMPVSGKAFSNGVHNISFPLQNNEISNGVYIIKVTTGTDVVTKKFVISK